MIEVQVYCCKQIFLNTWQTKAEKVVFIAVMVEWWITLVQATKMPANMGVGRYWCEKTWELDDDF